MAVDLSKFSSFDKNEVEELIKSLQKSAKSSDESDILEKEGFDKNLPQKEKQPKIEIDEDLESENLNLDSTAIKPKLPEEIIEKQKEEELKEFNISEVKDYESGYDLGKLEEIKQLISDYKMQGKPTADLEAKLEKMLADFQRKKDLNEDIEKDEDHDLEHGNIDLSSFYVDGEGSFDEIRKELLNLTADLLAKGVLKVVEIGKNMMNYEDDYDLNKVYVLADNLSEEDSKDVDRLNDLNALTFEKLQEEGLIVFTNESEEEDKLNQSYFYLLPKDYDGEKDYLKMTKEDIIKIRNGLKNDPSQFEIFHAHTLCKEGEKVVEEVVDKVFDFVKSTTIKISDMISKFDSKIDDISDIFNISKNLQDISSVKKDDSHKTYGTYTEHVQNERNNREDEGRGR